MKSPKPKKETPAPVVDQKENASSATTTMEKPKRENEQTVPLQPSLNPPSIQRRKSLKIEIPFDNSEEKPSRETKNEPPRAESETPKKEQTLPKRPSFRMKSVAPSPRSANDPNSSTISKRVHEITETSLISNNTTGINSSFDKGASKGNSPSHQKLIQIIKDSLKGKSNGKLDTSKGLKVSSILTNEQDRSPKRPFSKESPAAFGCGSYRPPTVFISPREKPKIVISERSAVAHEFRTGFHHSNNGAEVQKSQPRSRRPGNGRVPVLTMESIKKALAKRKGQETIDLFIGTSNQNGKISTISKGSMKPTRPRTAIKGFANLRSIKQKDQLAVTMNFKWQVQSKNDKVRVSSSRYSKDH